MIRAILNTFSFSFPTFRLPPLSNIKKEFIHCFSSAALIWQILFFYLPISLLLIASFIQYDEHGALQSISFKHFRPICNSVYLKVICNSLALSLTTAVITFFVSFPLAYYLVFHTSKYKYFLLFLLIIPFWTNFLLHVYAWFFILEQNGPVNQLLLFLGIIKEPLAILHTKFATTLLMVYYYLPFFTLPLFSSLERFDKKIFEASLTLGASKKTTITRILIPVLKNAIIGGFFLVFISAFGEFLIPEFMGGDKTFYIGNVISILLLNESTKSMGLAFTVLSTLIMLVVSFLLYISIQRVFNSLQRKCYD